MTIQTQIDAAETVSPLVAFWNQILAPKLITYRHILVDGLSRHSQAIMPKLALQAGHRVLDVGCGFGDTSLELGRRVGASGDVVGVDCCQALLDLARQDAQQQGAAHVSFRCQDMELGLQEGDFDYVFARFGTMFFSNPVAGLRAMRAAMRPGGRMAHIVWRRRIDNPWLARSRDVVQQILPKPGETAQTCGPGPFSMADQATTRMQMEAAGFADIRFERIDAKVLVGRTVEEAIAFQLALGPAGETFREAGALGERRRTEVETALAAMFDTVDRDDHGLWMDSSSWLITATNPAQ